MSPQSGAVLHATGITVTRAAATILDDVSLTVAPGDRIGLVGPNGVGKSTLLATIAGQMLPTTGVIQLQSPTSTIGFLPQEPDLRAAETLAGHLARRTGVQAADDALTAATDALTAGTDEAAARYDQALQTWMDLGGADFAARSAQVCGDLGLPAGLLDERAVALSGGQAARASLAAILLSRHDVLLLDEPTNDLDLDGLARLERFVSHERRGGLVVVSHDRAFLERVVTEVVEIDAHTHRVTRFGGGYQAFLEQRETDRRHARERYASARSERAALTDRVHKQRQWSENATSHERHKATDNDKFIGRRRAERTEKQASKVRSSLKAIERLDTVEKPFEGWELDLQLAASGRSGDIVARLDDAVLRRGTFTLGPVTVEVGWGERIAIAGPNGSGKTTLLGALLGRLPLDAGTSRTGPSVVVGELDQARTHLVGEAPLVDAFIASTSLVLSDARSLLAKFGLGADHVARPAGSLSPGERTRAGLAILMARHTNCLVLDEPTNHLDVAAIEQLEAALARWEGTLLLVTHDRRLTEQVAVDRTITMGTNGRLVGDSLSD
ncbi:MAG TPA: ABC-F family ATP-binding cassette domain-containing protein [Acidimicrobiales bacterium]|nr:ABC-F family ATP-binding cassette domain-containing protein [Acidimicrobiales bacterium]